MEHNNQNYRTTFMGGWIKVPRSIMQWNWYEDTITKAVFLHLLLLANHSDVKWRDIVIQRGQLVTSYIHLSQALHISVQQVKTAIKHLKSTSEITTVSTNKYTLVTVCHYDCYQNTGEQNNSQLNQQKILQKTFEKHTNNNQSTTNKNSNNENNMKEQEECENKDSPSLSIIKNYWLEQGFYKSKPEDFFRYYTPNFPQKWQFYADKWEEREKEKSCDQKESRLPNKKIDYSQANLTF